MKAPEEIFIDERVAGTMHTTEPGVGNVHYLRADIARKRFGRPAEFFVQVIDRADEGMVALSNTGELYQLISNRWEPFDADSPF